MSKLDIKVEKLSEKEYKGIQPSNLVVDIYGNDVNEVVVNTLRRGLLDELPTYAYFFDTIDITENTSVFDNDMMRLRIEQLPIYNVDSKIDFLDDNYWLNVDYTDNERKRHPKDKLNIELVVNIVNETSDILDVTTHDAELYINDELSDNYQKKDPVLLVRLRPNDSFKCRARGVLGLGRRNNIWSAISTCYYDDYKDFADNEESHKFKLIVEGSGQMKEMDLLKRVCRTINQKLDNVESIIKKKYYTANTNEKSIIIELDNETHTIGNIINDCLQNHKKVKSSGLSKPTNLMNQMIIQLHTLEKNPLKIFFEAVNNAKNIFNTIEEQCNKVKSKTTVKTK